MGGCQSHLIVFQRRKRYQEMKSLNENEKRKEKKYLRMTSLEIVKSNQIKSNQIKSRK